MDNRVEIIIGARNATTADLESLKKRLKDLGDTIANAKVNVDDKAAQASLARLAEQFRRLNGRVLSSTFKLEGVAHAEAQLAALDAGMDRLNKKIDSGSVLRNLFKGVSVTPLGVAAGLSPALIPIATGLGAALSAVAVSFGAAAIGAGAFGLMAKSAFTGAATAADKVQTAQNNYSIAVAAGTKKAVAYKAEQIAIGKAYAEMSTQQIALSQQVHTFSDAWQAVQQKLTPVVSGALIPWMKDVTLLMADLPALVRPVAAVFEYWGQVLHRYLGSSQGSAEIHRIVTEFGKFAALQLSDVIVFIVDLGKGIANLARDVSAHGVDFYAFGTNLQRWGNAFAKWSESAGARKDVNAFLTYVHNNGSVILGIIKDIAKYLPGIFAGASAAGTLELQALGSFLNLVAKLPPGLAKPVTELAGALLLLQKTGTIKVGMNLVGFLAEHPMAAGLTIGAALAAGVVLGIKDSTAKGRKQTLGQWWDSFGPPSKGQQQTWLNSWSGLGDRIVQIADDVRHGFAAAWDLLWNNTAGRVVRGGHDVEAALDPIRHFIAGWGHDIAHAFDVFRHAQGQFDAFGHDMSAVSHAIAGAFDWLRHSMASSWDSIWHDAGSALKRLVSGFDSFRHGSAAIFDSLRHGIASTWDSIWSTSNNQAKNGVGGITSWFKSLPGRVVGALRSLGSSLYNIAKGALLDFLHGMESVAGSILSWVGNFVSNIWSKVKKFFGISSPSSLFASAGKNLMLGLAKGIKDHAHHAVEAARMASTRVANVGSGVQRWAGVVSEALGMEGLSPMLRGRVLYQMQTESGGNPNAINLTDSNAAAGDPSRGLMQTIMSTFQAYHWPGTSNNIYDPLANVAAALNYARHVYGPTLMSSGMGIGSGHGYGLGTGSAKPGWAWVGEYGPELVKFQGGESVAPVARGGSGGSQHVTLEIAPGGSALFEQFMAEFLKKYVRIHGGGNVQRAFGRT